MKASPNWCNGRFVNPLPPERFAFGSMLKEWFRGNDYRTPKDPLPVVFRKGEEFRQPPLDALRITWLGHSSLLLEIDGHLILIDPVWSERASPFNSTGPKRFFDVPVKLEELPPLDAVVISHDHYDHLDRETVVALAERGVRFIMPLGVGAHLEHWGVSPKHIVELDWWEEVSVGALKLVATPARHFSGRSGFGSDRYKTLWAGFAMIGPNHRVFYSGDTAMFPGFTDIGERFGPFDLTLIEIGAYNKAWRDYHIGPEQALDAHRMLDGKLMIPVHWGTFNLAFHSWTEPAERLIVAAQRAKIAIAIPRPGVTVDVAHPPDVEKWWPQIPWQTAPQAPILSSGL